ncbi:MULTISPECIES: type VI secretion system baseplate subunit TssK [Pseudoalteromonas]|uniref:Type VI secretion system protein ImpJ n=1 Tax=Pseudoalteromonas peptidolytica F12-50-A1 TaxID=1315280 RepID=A0A8I0MSP8_9GAMM|nr:MULTISPECIES: type VI secretion system baseplate subunit TssK [Pseudoalteromonas]MBE0344712.1 type VI secretion system protein ImpJ [Pseudoalteromonas peptidolytica F12-50-A1]MDW7551238.1 type VI secretion system baseplate subunit TssK [Pseudoalteromonas peptidolytica]NLR14441.1 type VI secretion system baseplate subunit TssK [Pseudoalteromonas peptidolytica]RRS10374.1 type VI secretion system baseplate subunit TssK [Pseudoalteromonas sp. J010]RXE98098.1 type VI secretion system baseplate s
MSNKIVWREGTFLYPQHFQQMEAHLENVTQQYSALTTSEFAPHCGLAQLKINEGLLKLGQFSVMSCEGILPDGQYFKLSHEIAFQIPAGTIDQMVYLVVPAYLAGNNSFDNGASNSRYTTEFARVFDFTNNQAAELEIETARLNVALKLEQENLDGFVKLAVGKVLEVGSDGEVVIDRAFIPDCLSIGAADILLERVKELETLANAKVNQLLTRLQSVVDTQSNSAWYKEQQLLTVIYHWLPWLEATQRTQHYKLGRFYFELKQFEAALLSIDFEMRTPWTPLTFDSLYEKFHTVLAKIKDKLSITQQQNVIEYIWDKSLFDSRRMLLVKVKQHDISQTKRMVIAVTSPQSLAKELFTTGFKLAGNKSIINCIKNATPGVRVSALPYAPPELKEQGSTEYFQIDLDDPLWVKIVDNKEMLALHIDARIHVDDVKLFLIS